MWPGLAVLSSLVMKLAAGWLLEEPHPQLTSHCFLTRWKTDNVNMFIYTNQYFPRAFGSLYFTALLSLVVENIVLFASWCPLSAIRQKRKKHVCSTDVANKPSHEFRTGYWLEGNCLESNYIKGRCGNICHTKLAADGKQGPTRQ